VRQKDKPSANVPMLGPVKGFRDFSGKEAEKREEIRKIIVSTFEKYGFEPAETPIIESEEFVRGENQSDEAVSDIFKLQDKAERKLALRYEFTFQLKRLMKNKKLPYKRYQIGPVFRNEPVAENRFRQFTQCDVDTISSSVEEEAEVLAVANEIFEKLGPKPIILVNNRALLNEILDDLDVKEKDRRNVLREIDKYGKISDKDIIANLKKYNADKVLKSLKQGERYFSKFPSYKNISNLMKYCKLYGVKVLFSPTVIRGLSYYNGNIFEIKVKDVRETLAAGGSYMFNGIQCTGISFGLDRMLLISKVDVNKEKYLVISLGQDGVAIKLANKLRRKGSTASVYYGKPSKALDYANAYGFNKVVFVGAKEVKAKKFKVKDMKTGKESGLKA
ncbi:MAG: HisS family protein, partial [Ignavibacteria bacterium]|nr:HisS family protein [Ignavibacteria bacterium]